MDDPRSFDDSLVERIATAMHSCYVSALLESGTPIEGPASWSEVPDDQRALVRAAVRAGLAVMLTSTGGRTDVVGQVDAQLTEIQTMMDHDRPWTDLYIDKLDEIRLVILAFNLNGAS